MGQANQKLLLSSVYPRRRSHIEIPFKENELMGAHGKRPYTVYRQQTMGTMWSHLRPA